MSISNDNRARREPRVFVEFRPSMRHLIEEAVESLLLLLDELDGDADFEAESDEEEGGDLEPSLGSPCNIDQTGWGEKGNGWFEIGAEGPDDNGVADDGGVAEVLGLVL